MSQPPSEIVWTPQSRGVLVVRILAGILGGLATLLWLLLVVMLASEPFDTRPYADPHGYRIIFGTLLLFPAGLFAVIVVPFAFPQWRWARAFAITFAVFIVGQAVMFAVLYFAS